MGTKGLFSRYRRVTVGSVQDGTEPELHGKYGFIMPYDADTLAVFITGAQRLHAFARKAEELDARSTVFNRGDHEGTVHVPNALLDVAAETIGAHKRRQLSETTKAALRERCKAHHFPKQVKAQEEGHLLVLFGTGSG